MSGGAPIRTGGPHNPAPRVTYSCVLSTVDNPAKGRVYRADDVVERPHLAAVRVPGQLQVHPTRDGLLHHYRLVREQDRRPRRIQPG